MPLVPETSPQRRKAIPVIAAGLALLILTPLILLLPSAISWDMPLKLRAGRYQFHAGRDLPGPLHRTKQRRHERDRNWSIPLSCLRDFV